MKKILTLLLVLGLVAGAMSMPAHAKKKPKKVSRTVEFTYVCPCVGAFQFGSATGTNLGGGPMAVAGEKFLAGAAVDTTGQPVPVSIEQDTNGDGFNDPVGSFCGKTKTPITITPGLEIRVFVGEPSASCPGPAAGGTIHFTLSNLP
jgi:hypothetical protein